MNRVVDVYHVKSVASELRFQVQKC